MGTLHEQKIMSEELERYCALRKNHELSTKEYVASLTEEDIRDLIKKWQEEGYSTIGGKNEQYDRLWAVLNTAKKEEARAVANAIVKRFGGNVVESEKGGSTVIQVVKGDSVFEVYFEPFWGGHVMVAYWSDEEQDYSPAHFPEEMSPEDVAGRLFTGLWG